MSDFLSFLVIGEPAPKGSWKVVQRGRFARLINDSRKTAPWCEKGLATVQLQEGSTFQEDQKNKYQHITTAIGYCVHVEWPLHKPVSIVDVRFGY